MYKLYNFIMKEIAIIGTTASGKSKIALKLAQECNAFILSLDSLSVYKEIDIASAKPSKDELGKVLHFGVDEIYPNEHFNINLFIKIYQEAKRSAIEHKKNLIIVGGTSFYLKTLLDGLSPMPKISDKIKKMVKVYLLEIKKSYLFLKKIDPKFAEKISSNDRYRIEKALLIYFSTKKPPTLYFKENPKKRIIKKIDIYEINIDKNNLIENIKVRTKSMIKSGLIDEIAYLEKKYTRDVKPLNAIGIKETLDYLDGKLTKKELEEKIAINTIKLAKRQQTFNKTQFKNVDSLNIDTLYKKIKNRLS